VVMDDFPAAPARAETYPWYNEEAHSWRLIQSMTEERSLCHKEFEEEIRGILHLLRIHKN
jgi:hypothetical protein